MLVVYRNDIGWPCLANLIYTLGWKMFCWFMASQGWHKVPTLAVIKLEGYWSTLISILKYS